MRADNIRRVKPWASALLLRPERRFWLIVGLIALGGAVLRVLIHDYGLPWFEEIDELRIWFMGRLARGVPVPVGPTHNYSDYPPLIIWLHHLAQPLAEAQGRPLAVHAALDLRRVMLVFNVVGTVWFAMLGRRCGGALAGVIAATLWAFDTTVLDVTVFAIGESLAIPLLVLSVLLAVHVLESGRHWQLALVSMGLGVLCFLGDYRLLVTVFPGFAVLVWRVWRRYRPGWRSIVAWSIAFVALAGAAVTLILARLPERFQSLAQEILRTYLWDFDAFLLISRKTLGLVSPFMLPLILVLILLRLRSRPVAAVASLSTPAMVIVAVTMMLYTWAVSTIRPYGLDSLQRIWSRHLLPALLMFYLLLASTVNHLLSGVQEPRLRNLMRTALLAYALLILLPPALRLVHEYRVLPWPVIVRNWVDENLASSTILVYADTERWFDPFVGGMPHRVWFDWWKVKDIRDYPLKELRETHKITWALIPYNEHSRLTSSLTGKELLKQMLLVRKFTAPPARRKSETFLYRLWRMQHETDVRFGEHIRLVGYDLHDPHPLPGDPMAFTFYWNAPTRPPENYSFFLHLVAADGTSPFAQVDGNPAVPERLTLTWNRADETLISPRFTLTLPPDLAPGDYRVLLGLYNFETGARLPLQDAQGDAWEVTQLRIPDS